MVEAVNGEGRRAVFLDRDGVIVVPKFRDGRSFAPTTLEDFRIFPDAPGALERLKAAGFLLIVVTNQPDVGVGKISHSTLDQMHEKLQLQLPVDDVYVCIHSREVGCTCRKPQPGMLIEAARKWSIEFGSSYLIGDRSSDIEAAWAVGCRSIFIDYKYREPETLLPDFRVGTIAEAAGIILDDSQRGGVKRG